MSTQHKNELKQVEGKSCTLFLTDESSMVGTVSYVGKTYIRFLQKESEYFYDFIVMKMHIQKILLGVVPCDDTT